MITRYRKPRQVLSPACPDRKRPHRLDRWHFTMPTISLGFTAGRLLADSAVTPTTGWRLNPVRSTRRHESCPDSGTRRRWRSDHAVHPFTARLSPCSSYAGPSPATPGGAGRWCTSGWRGDIIDAGSDVVRQ